MHLYFQWVAVMNREKGGGKGNEDDVTDVDLLFCVCEKRVDVDFHNYDMEQNTRYRVKYVQNVSCRPNSSGRSPQSHSVCPVFFFVVRFPRRRRCGHPGHPWCSAAPEEPQHRRAREGQRQGEGERWQQEDGELMSKLRSPTHTLKRSVCPEPPSGVHLVTSTWWHQNRKVHLPRTLHLESGYSVGGRAVHSGESFSDKSSFFCLQAWNDKNCFS